MSTLRTIRGRTALFYLCAAALALAAILFLVDQGCRPRFRQALAEVPPARLVILDAGHGGEDGGATVEGVSEAPINLAVAQKTALLLRFLGQDVRLTRADAHSLGFDPAATVRQNKNADLQARLEIWKRQPGNVFLSIHLNQFPQPRYAGAQVFYSVRAPESRALAETQQEALRAALAPDNARRAKPCRGVFLMEQITGTAVTVECGFLSNPEERARLQRPAYQLRAALAIAGGYLQYHHSWIRGS